MNKRNLKPFKKKKVNFIKQSIKGDVMVDNNKFNILYFENDSMKRLYESMDSWQKENKKRFHTLTVNEDNNQFCCIALTNPTEVILARNTQNYKGAIVTNGCLEVKIK